VTPTLAFDMFGTLVDPMSHADALRPHTGRPEHLARSWRAHQLEISWLVSLAEKYRRRGSQQAARRGHEPVDLLECSSRSRPCGFVDVQWSSDRTTWHSLGSYSGENDAAPGWERFALPFDSPGGNLRFRFELTSDSLCSGAGGPLCSSPDGWDGAHIDDIAVGVPAS
jgi:hypothetical protein